MKYRKLRIAWSVAWGLVAVMLCVLWVRSYWWEDQIEKISSPRVRFFASTNGRLTYMSFDTPPGFPPGLPSRWTFKSLESTLEKSDGTPFAFRRQGGTLLVGARHYTFVIATSLLAAVPWIRQLPKRFSLRTLLIATTLVAVGLGVVVWIRK